MPTCPKCRTQYPEGTSLCATDNEPLLPDEAFSGVDPDLEAGQVVGEYEVEGKLGEGGFGTVYKGVHPLIGKRVAIKVLNREFSANPEIVSRFISEARAVNQIQHRNIIDIFSFGQLEDKRQYFVMEMLEGMPLDGYLSERGRLPVEEAVAILRPISRALDAAHAQGIAHRDLKPENIFLSFFDDGQPFPKLLDFGIAKLMGDHTSGHKTGTGMPIGTPYYMSPEQCRGRGVDHRTDVYSFGVMLFELLTGNRPFQGEEMMDLMLKHMSDTPPSITTLAPELRPELDQPLLHMMAKEASARPQTVSEALEQFARVAGSAGYSVESVAFSSAGKGAMGSNAAMGSGATVRAPTPIFTPASVAQTVAGTTASTGATLPAKTEQGKKGTIIAVAGVVLVGVAAAAVVMFTGSKPEPEPTGAAPPVASPDPGAVEAPAAEEEPKVDPAAVEAPVVSKTIELTVESKPDLVDVFVGKKKLGDSSKPFEIDRAEEPVELEFKANGYFPKKLEVTPKANSVVSVTLKRIPTKKTVTKKKSEIEF